MTEGWTRCLEGGVCHMWAYTAACLTGSSSTSILVMLVLIMN